MQFGGHLEAADRSLADGAEREGREESGIPSLRLWRSEPVDLDRHALSPAFGRCREHLDVGFLAVATAGTATAASPESDDVAWWPLDGLPDGIVADLPARLERAVEVLHAG